MSEIDAVLAYTRSIEPLFLSMKGDAQALSRNKVMCSCEMTSGDAIVMSVLCAFSWFAGAAFFFKTNYFCLTDILGIWIL